MSSEIRFSSRTGVSVAIVYIGNLVPQNATLEQVVCLP
jgi:hypothetical protein